MYEPKASGNASATTRHGQMHDDTEGDRGPQADVDAVWRKAHRTHDGVPAAAATAAPHGQTTSMTISAMFEEIPGKSKDVVQRAKENDALWFSPLSFLSNVPRRTHKTQSCGVALQGQTVVDTYAVPITDGPDGEGLGSVTAQLKYANSIDQSYSVRVDNVAGAQQQTLAKRLAQQVVKQELRNLGDIDQIEQAATAVVGATFPNASVHIKPGEKSSATTIIDGGQVSFFYRARKDPQVLMRILARPVGENAVETTGSSSTETHLEGSHGVHDEHEKDTSDTTHGNAKVSGHAERSESSEDIEYDETAISVLNDFVSRAEQTHRTLISNLSDKLVKDGNVHTKGSKTEETVSSTSGEGATHAERKTEQGQRRDRNVWSYLEDAFGIAKDVTNKVGEVIPLGGKVLRRLNWWSWGFDLAEDVAGRFAEKGVVDFADVTEDSDHHDTSGGNTTKTTNEERTTTTKGTDDRRRLLTEALSKSSSDTWSRFKLSIDSKKSKYHKKNTSSSSGASGSAELDTKHSENSHDSSRTTTKVRGGGSSSRTIAFRVNSNLKFTQPYIEGRVIAGNGKVSRDPFSEESDE